MIDAACVVIIIIRNYALYLGNYVRDFLLFVFRELGKLGFWRCEISKVMVNSTRSFFKECANTN